MPTLSNTGASYGPVSKFFHWVIAFLVIAMLAGTYFIYDIPDKPLKGMVFNIHKLTGICILGLMLLRTLWALINPKPLSMPNQRRWERFAERFVHVLFYCGLLAMPILGWVASVAGGHPPRWGQFAMGLPIPQSDSLSEFLFNLHNKLAIVLIVLITLHVLAALYHYYVKKDVVMRRMWPGK